MFLQQPYYLSNKKSTLNTTLGFRQEISHPCGLQKPYSLSNTWPKVSTHVFALKGRSILAQGNALGTTDNIGIAAL